MEKREKIIILMPISDLSKQVIKVVSGYFNEVLFFSRGKDVEDYLSATETLPKIIIGDCILEDQSFVDFMRKIPLEIKHQITFLMINSLNDDSLIPEALKLGVLEFFGINQITDKLDSFLYDFLFSLNPGQLRGKILCVEDSTTQQKIIKSYLSDTALELLFTDNVDEAIRILGSEDIDLVIVDYLLKGNKTGLDLVKLIRRNKEIQSLPVIAVTSFDDVHRKREFLKIGADDYIIKPFDKIDFFLKIRNLMQKQSYVKSLIRELEIQRNKLLRDPLTGVYNRNAIEFVERELISSKRHSYDIAIIIFDIDNFKNVNDTYGHPVGDQVLREVARILSTNIRKSDYLIRLGGEEFLMCLTHSNMEESLNKCSDLLRIVEMSKIIQIPITLSAGLVSTEVYPEESNLDKLIKLADDALYEAKRSGKNKVVPNIPKKS